MHGPLNVKFVNAKQAKQTYQYNQNKYEKWCIYVLVFIIRVICASSWSFFTGISLLFSDKHRAYPLAISEYLTSLCYRQVKSYTDFTAYV